MNESKLGYTFIAVPIDLLSDTNISHAAYRLWGHLNEFGRERDSRGRRKPPEIKALQKKMDAGERSIYRWLCELKERRWIRWERYADRTERITTLTPLERANYAEVDVIAATRALLANDHASREEYRQVLALLFNFVLGGVPSLAELPPLTELPRMAELPHTAELPPVTHSPPPESNNLIAGSNSLPQRSDTMIGMTDTLPHRSDSLPAAAKSGASAAVLMQQNSFLKTHESHETPEIQQTTSEDDRVVVENKSGFTRLGIWLVQQGMGEPAATRHQHHDEQAAMEAFTAYVGDAHGQEREHRIGGLVLRWDAAPPIKAIAANTACSPHVSLGPPLPLDQARIRAHTIAPADATEAEIADLADELSLGTSQRAALERLYYQRYIEQHIPCVEDHQRRYEAKLIERELHEQVTRF